MSDFSTFGNLLLLKAFTFWKLFLMLKTLTLFLKFFFSVLESFECFWICIFSYMNQILEDFPSRNSSSILCTRRVLWSLLPYLLFHHRSERFGKFLYLIFLYLVHSCCLKLLIFFPNYVLNLWFIFRSGAIKIEELSDHLVNKSECVEADGSFKKRKSSRKTSCIQRLLENLPRSLLDLPRSLQKPETWT